MSFVKNYLDSNSIYYIEKGNNVRKGHVAIKCPYCGDEDKSTHCNVSLKNGAFKCWRSSEHKGNFRKLSKLLTGTFFSGYIPLDPANVFKGKEAEQRARNLKFQSSFEKITRRAETIRFWNYLHYVRGFEKKDINRLIKRYKLKACLYGSWQDRIIYPVYYGGNLVTYIGRDMKSETRLPYRELEQDKSVIPAYDCLGNFDAVYEGGESCVITEGIFDMLKIDFYTDEEVKATCLFTLRLKGEGQEALLFSLRKKYNRFFIMLDKGAEIEALQLREKLAYLPNLQVFSLPSGYKDPGEMIKKDIKKLNYF